MSSQSALIRKRPFLLREKAKIKSIVSLSFSKDFTAGHEKLKDVSIAVGGLGN